MGRGSGPKDSAHGSKIYLAKKKSQTPLFPGKKGTPKQHHPRISQRTESLPESGRKRRRITTVQLRKKRKHRLQMRPQTVRCQALGDSLHKSSRTLQDSSPARHPSQELAGMNSSCSREDGKQPYPEAAATEQPEKATGTDMAQLGSDEDTRSQDGDSRMPNISPEPPEQHHDGRIPSEPFSGAHTREQSVPGTKNVTKSVSQTPRTRRPRKERLHNCAQQPASSRGRNACK
jgi:hypothetical protein